MQFELGMIRSRVMGINEWGLLGTYSNRLMSAYAEFLLLQYVVCEAFLCRHKFAPFPRLQVTELHHHLSDNRESLPLSHMWTVRGRVLADTKSPPDHMHAISPN